MANRMIGSGSKFVYDWTVPRRPASAYGLYIQDHYRRLRKHFVPRIRDQRQILNYCYETWKTEPHHIKARYAEFAKQDKERAYRDRIHWLKMVQSGETPYVPLRRHRTRPPGFPKLPRNSFMRFAAEMRPVVRHRYSNMEACEVMREIAKRWKSMDSDQKQPYLEASGQERAQYKQQKRQFRLKEKQRRRLKRLAAAKTRLNDTFNQRIPAVTQVSNVL